MPFYQHLGKIPPKRHTAFKKPNGDLYYEQVFGTIGFDGMASTLYHEHRPTQVMAVDEGIDVAPKIAIANNIKSLRLHGFKTTAEGDHLSSRKTILTNSAVDIVLAAPIDKSTSFFYKNADADEVLFIHKGSGKLRTSLGNITFAYGDYLVIPRGIIYTIDFDSADNRLLIINSRRPIYTPKRYRNKFGQLLEHSPYCERDIRTPNELETHTETGKYTVKVRKQNRIFELTYKAHPFDVVGWDGYNFPYALSIHDFEPITGRIHQPPPVHQTFETDAFVICSFVPRLYDYHPQSIPAPYHHSNIDSDEVLYYVDGDFMSRNDIDQGHISLHPAGIPHGPHPGSIERSIGKKATDELAVMVDTFNPLKVTEEGLKLSDQNYYRSWIDETH